MKHIGFKHQRESKQNSDKNAKMFLIFIWKKSLKPPKCHLQEVNPDNTMTKRYSTKRV